MGKVSSWFRGLLGKKKNTKNMDDSNAKTKKIWCFGKSMGILSQRVTVENDSTCISSRMSALEKEQNNNAIAVAVAATSAAATNAAVAGADAVVSVSRLTIDDRGPIFSNAKTKKISCFEKSVGDPSQRVTVENDSTRISSGMSALEKEQNKNAIAVAATAAAAADVAVAGAHAEVSVSRLTSDDRGPISSGREIWAATKIQSVYRGHLARRALRALKGLVKFQALVRGFHVRKQVAATLYSMQALLRAQLAARYERARRSLKDHRVQPKIRHRKSLERFDNDTRREIHSKHLSTSYDSKTNLYAEIPKIVGMDTYRPHGRSRRNRYHDAEWGFVGKDYKCSITTRSMPRFAYSNRSYPPTPPKSVCRDAFYRPYLNHASYMANTQSFSAKQRSHISR